MDLFSEAYQFLEDYRSYPWYVALSGGIDSVVLLETLLKNYPGHVAGIIHVNHQLQEPSQEWELFCQSLAEQHVIPFHGHRLILNKPSESSAREGRYHIFEHYLEEPALVLLGHHLDDRLETMLWRFLRGSPLQGLVNMKSIRKLNSGWIVRPLLSVARQHIMDYALKHSLEWCTDPTNAQTYYTRNFIRNKAIPLLESRFPSLKKQLSKTLQLCQEEYEALNYWTEPYCRQVDHLDLNEYPDRSHAGLKTLCLAWLARHQHPQPSLEAINQFIPLVMNGKKAILTLEDQFLITQYGLIWLESKSFFDQALPQTLTVGFNDFPLTWGVHTITLNNHFNNELITIRRLKKSDVLPQHNKAQVYWRHHRISAFHRRLLPAIFQGNTFIQYANYCYNESLFSSQPFDVNR